MQSRTSELRYKRKQIVCLQATPAQSDEIWNHQVRNYHSLRRLQGLDLGLHVGTDIITPVDVVCDLGILLDSKLTMKKHISTITSACFYHL